MLYGSALYSTAQFAENRSCQSCCIGEGRRTVLTALVQAQEQFVAQKRVQFARGTNYAQAIFIEGYLLSGDNSPAA
jgi:hypothetical protein